MKNNIILQLLAVDFKDTDFVFGGQCAIEKAVTRQLGTEIVSEGVSYVRIDNKIYDHENYNSVDFLFDQLEAEKLSDDSLIRTVVLKKR